MSCYWRVVKKIYALYRQFTTQSLFDAFSCHIKVLHFNCAWRIYIISGRQPVCNDQNVFKMTFKDCRYVRITKEDLSDNKSAKTCQPIPSGKNELVCSYSYIWCCTSTWDLAISVFDNRLRPQSHHISQILGGPEKSTGSLIKGSQK